MGGRLILSVLNRRRRNDMLTADQYGEANVLLAQKLHGADIVELTPAARRGLTQAASALRAAR